MKADAPDAFELIQFDKRHLLLKWGETEIILSIATGDLWGAVYVPGGVIMSAQPTEKAQSLHFYAPKKEHAS